MSSNFVEEQNEDLSEFFDNAEKQLIEKKSLSNVLASYMKKQDLDKKDLEKLKKEFLQIKNNMNEAKSTFETLMDIQKKLSKAYNKLNEKEDEQIKT